MSFFFGVLNPNGALGASFYIGRPPSRLIMFEPEVFAAPAQQSGFLSLSNNPTELLIDGGKHSTSDLNLEAPSEVAHFSRMLRQGKIPVADLRLTEVYLLGADADGTCIGSWQRLRGFWIFYFKEAGADFRSYSPLREGPGVQLTP